MISTRHIRKDWPEWVDWQNQKTVSTMCGVRSQPRLCGIPGITFQPIIVERAGGKAWGWCRHCVKKTWPYYLPPALEAGITSTVILDLHRSAQEQLVVQYKDILIGLRNHLMNQSARGDAKAVEMDIDKLMVEFPRQLSDSPVS